MQFHSWNEASFGQMLVLALSTPPPENQTVKPLLYQFVSWLLHEIEQGRRPAILADCSLQKIHKCVHMLKTYDTLTEEDFTQIYSQLK